MNAFVRLFACCSLVVLVAVLTATKIGEYDFWYHVKLGESVLGQSPLDFRDTLSYTFAGLPQFSGEWLGDLLIYLSFVLGGFHGANALKFCAVGLALYFLFAALVDGREDSAPAYAAALLTVALVVFAMRFRFFIRPYMFSYAFIGYFLMTCTRYRRSGEFRALLVLPLAAVLWANMSKGVFYGPLICAFFAAGEWLRGRRDRRLFWGLAVVTAAAMAGPEGWGVYTMPFKYVLNEKDSYMFVGEHQAVTTALLFGFGLKYTVYYQILAVLSIIYFVAMKGWKNVFHVLLFAALGIASLRMVRMIDFFSLAAGLFAVEPLRAAAAAALRNGRMQRAVLVFLACGMLAAAGAAAVDASTYERGFGIKKHILPEGAAAFVEGERIDGRMFNSYAFGGYLAWRLPDRKVFVDSRGPMTYSPEFLAAYFAMLRSPEAWDEGERRWGFDHAIVEYDFLSNNRHFPTHLAANPGWALVYWDRQSAVFVKRTPRYAPLIARHEYRIAKPTLYNFGYLKEALSPAGTADKGRARLMSLLAGIDREIALNPENQEPRLAKVFLIYFSEERSLWSQALSELEIAMRLGPDLAMKHSTMAAFMLEMGMTERAKAEVRRALALDPVDPAGLYLGRQLGVEGLPPAAYH